MNEFKKLGWPLLLLGGLLGLIEICGTFLVYFKTGEYHSFMTYTGGFMMAMGIVLIKLDEILDNQKEILKALGENVDVDCKERSEDRC